MNESYLAITKRRSVRKYDPNLKFGDEEMHTVKEAIATLVPLREDIATEFVIKPRKETNCRFNAEYCILAYSEKKPFWKENVGYMLEQLDLYFAARNVGACWYGMGSTSEKQRNGKEYAITYCFGKCGDGDFRSDKSEFTRKTADEILSDSAPTDIKNITEIARLAPSACNSQPWRLAFEKGELRVFSRSAL